MIWTQPLIVVGLIPIHYHIFEENSCALFIRIIKDITHKFGKFLFELIGIDNYLYKIRCHPTNDWKNQCENRKLLQALFSLVWKWSSCGLWNGQCTYNTLHFQWRSPGRRTEDLIILCRRRWISPPFSVPCWWFASSLLSLPCSWIWSLQVN